MKSIYESFPPAAILAGGLAANIGGYYWKRQDQAKRNAAEMERMLDRREGKTPEPKPENKPGFFRRHGGKLLAGAAALGAGGLAYSNRDRLSTSFNTTRNN